MNGKLRFEGQILNLGANAPEPLNHVRPQLCEEVVEILCRITRRPNQCLSKGQMQDVAETAIARNYVYERRLKMLRLQIEAFQKQLLPLDQTDPLAIAWGKIYNTLDLTLKGEHN